MLVGSCHEKFVRILYRLCQFAAIARLVRCALIFDLCPQLASYPLDRRKTSTGLFSQIVQQEFLLKISITRHYNFGNISQLLRTDPSFGRNNHALSAWAGTTHNPTRHTSDYFSGQEKAHERPCLSAENSA